jgi:hypothetical protein
MTFTVVVNEFFNFSAIMRPVQLVKILFHLLICFKKFVAKLNAHLDKNEKISWHRIGMIKHFPEEWTSEALDDVPD